MSNFDLLKMASPARPQTAIAVRNLQHIRAYRPPQRLTSSDTPSPVKVAGRKRVIGNEAPVLIKQKYEPDDRSRLSIQVQKPPDTIGSYRKVSSSAYSTAKTYEYGLDDQEDYQEVYYDQLPPRLSNTPKSQSPFKHKKHAVSVVNMGKAFVTGRKDTLTHEIDIQQLIDKYVNSETPKETEAWLVNIGLCAKLNAMNQEMERMRGEVSEMWECLNQRSKEGVKDRLTMQTPWPGERGEGCVMPTPFGASPAPCPPNQGDFVVPPIYSKNGVDCREIYSEIQRKGKKRPGVVFLTHFIRNLCAQAIESPYKSQLTIRSKNRKDELINVSPDFMKPIETFFLAACNVTSGLTYALGDMLREALAHELRELRRAPRKEKITVDEHMRKLLENYGAHDISLLDDEHGDDNEEREEEEEEHLEMEEVEVDDDL